MLWTPTYGGNAIFGSAVRIQMVAHPTANQVAEFFGISGIFNLFGGGRGRAFLIEGTIGGVGSDAFEALSVLNANEGIIHSYADGIGRVLLDTRGNSWPGVVFDDNFQPDPVGPRPWVGFYNEDGSPGWGLRYRAMFRGTL